MLSSNFPLGLPNDNLHQILRCPPKMPRLLQPATSTTTLGHMYKQPNFLTKHSTDCQANLWSNLLTDPAATCDTYVSAAKQEWAPSDCRFKEGSRGTNKDQKDFIGTTDEVICYDLLAKWKITPKLCSTNKNRDSAGSRYDGTLIRHLLTARAADTTDNSTHVQSALGESPCTLRALCTFNQHTLLIHTFKLLQPEYNEGTMTLQNLQNYSLTDKD